MPVISPHHTSSSYRSAFNNSLDRPSYYSSSSFNPRISTFSERYSTRTYIDSDGRRTFSRSSSITEDGVTSRFKEELRDGSVVRRGESVSRDIGSIRDNSTPNNDYHHPSRRVLVVGGDRDGSLSRDNSRLSSVDVLDDLADLRSKYSPSNYVPAIHRQKNNDNSNAASVMSRSKSINDIGLPPIEKSSLSSKKNKVTIATNDEVNNANNTSGLSLLPSNNTAAIATNNCCDDDNDDYNGYYRAAINNDDSDNDNNNGNRASVADLRKRFDNNKITPTTNTNNTDNVASTPKRPDVVNNKKTSGVAVTSENNHKFRQHTNNVITAANRPIANNNNNNRKPGQATRFVVKKPSGSGGATVVSVKNNDNNDPNNKSSKIPIAGVHRDATSSTIDADVIKPNLMKQRNGGAFEKTKNGAGISGAHINNGNNGHAIVAKRKTTTTTTTLERQRAKNKDDVSFNHDVNNKTTVKIVSKKEPLPQQQTDITQRINNNNSNVRQSSDGSTTEEKRQQQQQRTTRALDFPTKRGVASENGRDESSLLRLRGDDDVNEASSESKSSDESSSSTAERRRGADGVCRVGGNNNGSEKQERSDGETVVSYYNNVILTTTTSANNKNKKEQEGGDKRQSSGAAGAQAHQQQQVVVDVIYEEENDDEEGGEAASAQTERQQQERLNDLGERGVASCYIKEQAGSPKPNKTNNSSRLSPSSSATATSALVGIAGVLNTNSLGRKSVERERRSGTFDEDIYDRANTIVGYRLGTGSPTTVGAATSVKTLGLNGLKNIGNTCFMNSVIQCLSNTKLLLEYLRQDSYMKDLNQTISGMKGSLIKAFAEVIKELWAEDSCDRVVNTASLKGQIQRFAPRFMGYAQQDAQEFLRYLLEGLHEDVNRVTEKPTPIHAEIDDKLNDVEKSAESWNRYLRMDNSRIVDIFVGQLKSTLKCTFCGHCSVTFDPFWDLSLPIPTRTGQLRLSQCLESFTREETLDGDEKPTCSKCKERRKCTKSFSIQKFPKILVIHLKRFSPTERFRGKLSVTVDFPLEALDMSKYAAEGVASSRYNLYAVSNHSGTTYSGHYTAYCRHPYAMNWHEYNDSRVSSVSSRSIVSSEAYVLFYEQEGQRSHL